MEYISVEEARQRHGLRLVLTAGVPGPWGEAAKALVNYKEIDWIAARQDAASENAALKEWTGQASAPVFAWENLPPVCNWLDQVGLLDRIEPERPLLPLDPLLRAEAIGLAGLVAGPGGFGWQRRLAMIAPMVAVDPLPEQVRNFAERYGFSETALAESGEQFAAICQALDKQLAVQAERESPYFVGSSVTAADFYWACFLGMVRPLPREVNPMPEWAWGIYDAREPEMKALITERLTAHRDMMYRDYISLPLDF
jgi:glutathione S-transferase